jgi:hypothetical protein
MLLMDEPTVSMARTERVALMQLSHTLASLLFTEQDMDVVFHSRFQQHEPPIDWIRGPDNQTAYREG